jgi:hypothetical protein
MAGAIYEKAERREAADQLYARLVREYPSSKLVDPAKKKLTTAGVPIPQPDPAALARVNDNRKYVAQKPGLIKRTTALIHSGPDVTGAAHSGQPNLQPPPEATSATDILRPGAPTPGGVGTGVSSGNSVAVETVPVGSDAAAASSDNTSSVPASDAAPSDAGSLPAPMNDNSQPAAQPAAAPAEAAPAPGTAPAERPAPDAVATVGMNGATNASANGSTAPTSGSSGTESSSSTPAAKTNANDEQTASSAATADPKSESTSKKKKKGLKKIIPW